MGIARAHTHSECDYPMLAQVVYVMTCFATK